MYANTSVYAIKCRDPSVTDIYVGHTVDIAKRAFQHEKCAKTSDRKVYAFIREHGGWDNWYMEVLDTVRCNDRGHAHLEELYWYKKLKPTLNAITPGIYYYNRTIRNHRLYTKREDVINRINGI